MSFSEQLNLYLIGFSESIIFKGNLVISSYFRENCSIICCVDILINKVLTYGEHKKNNLNIENGLYFI